MLLLKPPNPVTSNLFLNLYTGSKLTNELITISVRFVGGLGGFNPPLVEDDSHTGD